MSRLQKGTKLARTLVENIALEGMTVKAIAFMPFLGLPILKQILEALIEHLVVDPALDDATAIGIAAAYFIDRTILDDKYIELSMLDESGATPEQREEALQHAESSLFHLVRRGPVE